MRDDQADRVSLAKEIGLHPHLGPNDIHEGEHYTVAAYCDWADYFVPTVIVWAHGPMDDLTDPEATRENKRKAKDHVRAVPN